jgi:two-component system, response regulator PdtaR
MTRVLRIAVADDEPAMREFYRLAVPRLNHHLVAVAATGAELVEGCRKERPDLVITDVRMPGRDGIDASAEVCREGPVPVLLVSGYHDPALLERLGKDYILAYLVKPIEPADLEAAIAVAVRRFEQFQALRQEAADLRQALEDRKLIERAKGILMRQAHVDEEEAFRRLQRGAAERNLKLVDVARILVTAEEILQPAKCPKR